MRSSCVLMLLVALQRSSGSMEAGLDPVINTPLGMVRGQSFPSPTNHPSGRPNYEFLGMRFAAPAQRYTLPQPVEPWKGIFNATTLPAMCPQLFNSSVVGKEDCLFINVWTNALGSDPSRIYVPTLAPVYVYIYGGGFLTGSSSDPTYSGQHMVGSNADLVVVTFNYRLGPLGLLSLPTLTAEQGHPSGMLFMEDQRRALQWVQTQIASFGGDPRRVTLGGESAGGISACLHSFSPLSQGLFSALIMESGNCGDFARPQAVATLVGQEFAQAAGCPDFSPSCLRAKSLGQLFLASAVVGGAAIFSFNKPSPWSPFVDQYNMMESPYVSLLKGTWNPIPVLIGANKDSFSLFVTLGIGHEYPNKTAALQVADVLMDETVNVSQWIAVQAAEPGWVPTNGTAVRQQLQSHLAGLPLSRDILVQAGSDAIFLCGTRRMAAGLAAYSRNIYYYSFQHHPSTPPQLLAWTGAYHFAEVPFVFGYPTCLGIFPPECIPNFTHAEQQLSWRMTSYWVNFVQSATSPNAGYNPGSAPQVIWPAYRVATDAALAFNLSDTIVTANDAQRCQLWDQLLFAPGVWPPGSITAGTTGPSANSGSGSSGTLSTKDTTLTSILVSTVLSVVLSTVCCYFLMRCQHVRNSPSTTIGSHTGYVRFEE